MIKQIKCDDSHIKDQVEKLLNYHLGCIDELVDRLEVSVIHTQEGEGEPLYLCKVVVTDSCSGRLAVEERQADVTLTVNRAIMRITRSLMRRQRRQQLI
jgi:ribosome-associated translation inhibitor RaiA